MTVNDEDGLPDCSGRKGVAGGNGPATEEGILSDFDNRSWSFRKVFELQRNGFVAESTLFTSGDKG